MRDSERELLKEHLGNDASAQDVRHELIADGMTPNEAPSEEALRKMKFQVKLRLDITNEWKSNLLATTKASKIEVEGDNVNGFIQKVSKIFAFACICKSKSDFCIQWL